MCAIELQNPACQMHAVGVMESVMFETTEGRSSPSDAKSKQRKECSGKLRVEKLGNAALDDGPTRHALVKGENVMRFAGPPAAKYLCSSPVSYMAGHDFPQIYDFDGRQCTWSEHKRPFRTFWAHLTGSLRWR